jgi:PKD repeat protein
LSIYKAIHRASITAVVLAVTLLVSTCGAHEHKSANVPHLQAEPSVLHPLADVSLDTALKDLRGLETPDDVAPALFQQLKDELTRQLLAKGVSTITSNPPTGEANRIDDLAIADNGDGTYTLFWHYRNAGDYDQNGTVGISDITPLAQHFGESVPEDDLNRTSIQAVIDGSGNGKVGIEDITAIAQNYQIVVHHYAAQSAASEDGPWEPLGDVAQAPGAGAGRLQYECVVSGQANLWLRVVACDAEGNTAESSNVVEIGSADSGPVAVISTDLTSGYCPLSVHFDGSGSNDPGGGQILQYAWDFTDDGLWDSYGPSIDHAYESPGNYTAVLRVMDEDSKWGYATVSITVEDQGSREWVHTWGGEYSDMAKGLAVDSGGNAYVTGYGCSDVILLKYSTDGSLLWAKTWGGVDWEEPTAIGVDSDGNAYVTGWTTSYTAGSGDAFLLKYSPEGTLLWQRTWGGVNDDPPWAIAVNGEEVYVTGYTTSFGEGAWDVFLLKYDADGNLLWQTTWGSISYEGGLALCVDSAGDVFVGGYRCAIGTLNLDVLLLKYDSDGALITQASWSGYLSETINSLASDESGEIFAAGITIIDDGAAIENRNVLLLRYSSSGELLNRFQWNHPGYNEAESIAVGRTGDVYVSGYSVSPDGASNEALLLGFSSSGEVLLQKSFGGLNDDCICSLNIDNQGFLTGAGWTMNKSSSWKDISGLISLPGGTSLIPDGITATPAGIESEPQGIEGEPEGVIDAGGGGQDILTLRVYPPSL